MVEVTRSSSRGNAQRDTNAHNAFDLRSWQGLTHVLKAARESGLAEREYAQFRDMILEYAQSGGDAALKTDIDAIIKTFSKSSTTKTHTAENKTTHRETSCTHNTASPSNDKREQKAQSHNGLGSTRARRRAPVFSIKKDEVRLAPPPHDLPVEVQEHEVIVEPQVQRPELAENTPPEKEPPAPQEPTVPRVSHEARPRPQHSQAETQKTEPTTTGPSVKSPEEYKERIAEIKRDVNARIGNPITLIDAGNEIGREYMNALLVAMKASGGGPAGSLATSMEALEDVYARIVKLASEQQPYLATDVPSQAVSLKEESSPPESEGDKVTPVSLPEEEDVSHVPETPPASAMPLVDIPTLQPEAPQEPEEKEQASAPDVVEHGKENPHVEAITSLLEEKLSQSEPRSEHASEEEEPSAKRSKIASLRDLLRNDTQPEEPASESRAHTPEHLAEDASQPVPEQQERARKPEVSELSLEEDTAPPPEVPHASTHKAPQPSASRSGAAPSEGAVPESGVLGASLQTEAQVSAALTPPGGNESSLPNQTELSSPQVTTALEQLLNEWSVFRKSGIFGIGSHGMEHPLYKDIKDLSMSEVLAGRWEKSTPEIKQTIKDYVNAWRYEQGISYTPNETFEHYLRRVVTRILKRQNRSQ